MALMTTPEADRGWEAPDFHDLPAVDGSAYSLEDVAGEMGLLVMFICNHCPYVKGVMDRLPETMDALQEMGFGVIAINSNDAEAYPEDSFEMMEEFAKENGFSFPYVMDETQAVARAYDAICTPDFFLFNADLELQYRGRLDSSGKDAADADTVPELLQAAEEIAEEGEFTGRENASMGCSIKWKS